MFKISAAKVVVMLQTEFTICATALRFRAIMGSDFRLLQKNSKSSLSFFWNPESFNQICITFAQYFSFALIINACVQPIEKLHYTTPFCSGLCYHFGAAFQFADSFKRIRDKSTAKCFAQKNHLSRPWNYFRSQKQASCKKHIDV